MSIALKPGSYNDAGAYIVSVASSLVHKPGSQYDAGACVVLVVSSLVHNIYDAGVYVAS